MGFAEQLLPSIFSVVAAWLKRLQSEVEVGTALNSLVDRVDLTDTGIRVWLKLPNSIPDEQQDVNAGIVWERPKSHRRPRDVEDVEFVDRRRIPSARVPILALSRTV
jgi:hypothetical protein